MGMKIVIGPPPNMEAITKAFGLVRKDAFFCYGDTIYTIQPRSQIDLGVIRHETVHSKQQRAAGGPKKWWDLYLSNPAFRREQEIEAYQAQCAFYRMKLPRKVMRQVELAISKQLAGPMYGKMMSRQEAMAAIRAVHAAPPQPQLRSRVKLQTPAEWDKQEAAQPGPVRNVLDFIASVLLRRPARA